MVFVSMTVIGLIAAFRLPLESMPEIQFPFLEVSLPYQGSDALRRLSASLRGRSRKRCPR
jgi:multidrug efflux pump subunit AcrB